ncbi:MAG: hypothetical protein ACKVT1_15920 [Dehalococcoidia bacterium]
MRGHVPAVFDPTLGVLSHLCSKGDAFIALAPPFSVTIEVERSTLGPHLAERNLSERDFGHASTFIGSMLLAILEDQVDRFVAAHEDEPDSDALGPEDAVVDLDLLRRQAEAVRTSLWTDHLQKRYDLKKSSKAPSFSGIDWDIKVKIADAKADKLRSFPYATCRISFQREYDYSVFAVLARPFDSIQINFSVDEVAYLARVFGAIRQQLESAEKEVLPWR